MKGLINLKNKDHKCFIWCHVRLINPTKQKDKKHFCMSCLQNVSTKKILNNHRKRCLLINGCQAVNHESGITKFTNCNKQIPIFLKICANTNLIL